MARVGTNQQIEELVAHSIVNDFEPEFTAELADMILDDWENEERYLDHPSVVPVKLSKIEESAHKTTKEPTWYKEYLSDMWADIKKVAKVAKPVVAATGLVLSAYAAATAAKDPSSTRLPTPILEDIIDGPMHSEPIAQVYALEVNETQHIRGRSVTLNDVSSAAACTISIDVDGTSEVVSELPEDVNGLEVEANRCFYDQVKENRSADVIVYGPTEHSHRYFLAVDDYVDIDNRTVWLRDVFIDTNCTIEVEVDTPPRENVTTTRENVNGVGLAAEECFYSETKEDRSAVIEIFHTGVDSDDYLDGYDNGYQDGQEEGYSEGFEDGNETGYQAGKQDGHDEGYLNGSRDGRQTGYQDGYGEGYVDGQENGLESGNSTGHQNGYAEGYGDGHEDGHDEGFDFGYDEGFKTAYRIGKEELDKLMSEERIKQFMLAGLLIPAIGGGYALGRLKGRGRKHEDKNGNGLQVYTSVDKLFDSEE